MVKIPTNVQNSQNVFPVEKTKISFLSKNIKKTKVFKCKKVQNKIHLKKENEKEQPQEAATANATPVN